MQYTFIGTDLTNKELTDWILGFAKKNKVKPTQIRYFGSRRFGNPRPDSDFDVYITHAKDKKSFGRNCIFSELFKKDGKSYQIEFHVFEDWNDGYIPVHLLGDKTENEI